jgi:hypothetical protein
MATSARAEEAKGLESGSLHIASGLNNARLLISSHNAPGPWWRF